MFDQIVFQRVEGIDSHRRLQLLALSTCGFCRRGQEFLEEHGLAYEYVHLDKLEPSMKAKAKEEFKAQFGITLSYPSLVVDGTTQTVGYVKRFWEDLLGLPHQDDVVEAEAVD